MAEKPTDSTLVIIPTYNEVENLPLIIGRVRESNPDVDILVVDDNSPDGTGDKADEMAAEDSHVNVIHREEKTGLLGAYTAGFNWGLERGYNVLCQMDADGSHAPEQLVRLLSAIDEGADLVIPVPESGNPAAVGYARESGITFAHGLVKNAYVGRTFIQPTQTLRQLGIRLKLNPLREVIDGKKLVVVDDSIVRGNTQRALIRMLREAGAAEVHVRIASPPVKWPCFYGIDFASPGELIANASPSDDPETVCATICDTIGADSLGFVSVEEMVAATEQPRSELCTACFTGEYPLGLPAGNSNADAVRTLLGTE